jgi:predicted component of type VI protein secretion system
MEAKLIVVGGRATKREIPLNLPAIIGRSRDAALTVAHPQISRQHCMLFDADGLLMLRDLGSTNGTFYQGNRVVEAPLLPDDTFSVGPLTFRASYEYLGDVSATPTPQWAPSPHATQPVAPPEPSASPWSIEPAALDSRVLEVPIRPHEPSIGPPMEPSIGPPIGPPIDVPAPPADFMFAPEDALPGELPPPPTPAGLAEAVEFEADETEVAETEAAELEAADLTVDETDEPEFEAAQVSTNEDASPPAADTAQDPFRPGSQDEIKLDDYLEPDRGTKEDGLPRIDP